ncbi:MAG TPA: hypothetical protein VMF30_00060, partial [Pirellulales bacterium]|nr:hypothetical protein [Pirellulales bacterium]
NAFVEGDDGGSVIVSGSIIAEQSNIAEHSKATLYLDEVSNAGGTTPGRLAAEDGGTLEIEGLSSNLGTIAAGVGSTVKVDGALVEDPSGVLSVDVRGTARDKFGQIEVADAARLAGTLEVNQVGGYVPAAGDRIPVITYKGGYSNSFSAIQSTPQGLFTATPKASEVDVSAASAVSAPQVTPSGSTNTYTVGGSPVPVDSGIMVTSSDTDLTGATLTIENFEAGDTLTWSAPSGITGSYNAGILTLSGSATVRLVRRHAGQPDRQRLRPVAPRAEPSSN